MHNATIRLCVLLKILQWLSLTHSQCPADNFRYYRDEASQEIIGIIEIPNPPKNVALYHLRVVLNVEANLLNKKYLGRVELEKSRDESFQNLLRGMPLFYKLYFPIRYPLPIVTSITLNELSYCSGHYYGVFGSTNIILEHNLFPPRVLIPLQLLNIISNYNITPGIGDKSMTDQYFQGQHVFKENYDCLDQKNHHNVNFSFTNNRGDLIVDSACGSISQQNGSFTNDNYWPWLVAIFFIRKEPKFQCTGNLISRQHVLTVGHCLTENNQKVSPKILLLSLGRQNIRDWKETNSINVAASSYKFHPDYRNVLSADANLAVIKLLQRIDYTLNIRPICLWMSNVDIEDIVEQFGHVVGWNIKVHKQLYSSEPGALRIPIVSQVDCLLSNVDLIEVTSRRTFCAGLRDGTGACYSTGSGFIMMHKRFGRYHLRGLVSLSLLDSDTKICNLKEYVVFVDVAQYIPWIQHEIIS